MGSAESSFDSSHRRVRHAANQKPAVMIILQHNCSLAAANERFVRPLFFVLCLLRCEWACQEATDLQALVQAARQLFTPRTKRLIASVDKTCKSTVLASS